MQCCNSLYLDVERELPEFHFLHELTLHPASLDDVGLAFRVVLHGDGGGAGGFSEDIVYVDTRVPVA